MKRLSALLVSLLLLMVILPGVGAAERVSIEAFVVHPWVTSELPDPEIDIRKNYIQDKFNIDYTLTYGSEGETTLLTRFQAGNPPDLIVFSSFNALQKFYEQDVLLSDWTPYLEKAADFVKMMGEDQLAFFTRDGKVIALATQPGGQSFTWMIRKDWLEKLDLAMPTTLDELYDVLYAFTYNDPDGNGENDTYGITSAGGGDSVGEIASLIFLFGQGGWHLGENGEATHPVLNGDALEFLDFLKKLYDGGVIDPNWYTQGWEERKAALFSGKYGMCWYPPDALLDENLAARKDEVADEWWTLMPLFSGKQPAKNVFGASILTVSDACAQDEAKMQAIIDMMNTFITPNDEYYELRRNTNIDGNRLIRLDNGIAYCWRDRESFPETQIGSDEGQFIGTAVYGQVFATYGDGYFGGETEEIAPHTQIMMDLVGELNVADRYTAESQFLTLDPTLLEEVNMVYNEFSINYVMGLDDDFDTFKEVWLETGGEELKAQADEQFAFYGFTK